MSSADLTEADLRHEVGTRLRIEREGKDLSLRAASQMADVAPSHLRAIERGESTPSLQVLVKLVGAYGSSMNRLLSQIGTPPPIHGRLDDTPGWRQLSEPALSMNVYQVCLAPGERTVAQLSGGGEILLYVQQGSVHLTTPTVERPLTAGDAAKMRHCDIAAWSSDAHVASIVLVGIGPSAQLMDVMVSASAV